MDIKQSVRAFIAKNFYIANPSELADETSFLDKGIIDSTSILELTAFLEETFDIQILDDELVPENLDSLEAVHAFVARKLDGRVVGGDAAR
jgi:acyl carrier protein